MFRKKRSCPVAPRLADEHHDSGVESIRPHRLLFAAGLAAVAGTAGCLGSPYDMENFSSTTSQIPFDGCSTKPFSPITLEMDNVRTGSWQSFPLANATTSVTYTDNTGVHWYCWQTTVESIAPDFWVPKGDGSYFVFMRVLDNGSPMYTYANDPSQCTQPQGVDQLTGSRPCALAPSSTSLGNSRPGGIVITASHQ